MSISQNPITGPMRKSFGTATCVRYAGKNIVRARIHKRWDPKTKKQLLHRHKFKLLVEAYQIFRGAIEEGFLVCKKGMTCFNMYISANLSIAFDTTGELPVINYSRLKLSKGAIPSVNVMESEIGVEGITIRYDTNIDLPKVSATDELTLIASLKDDGVIYTRQARGSENTGSMFLKFTDTKAEYVENCYLYVRTADGKKSSDSVYIQLNTNFTN